MVGLPTVLATKQDWLQSFDYVKTINTPELKNDFRMRLIALNNTRYMKVLKAGINKSVEEQTPEDFESVLDPLSSFVSSGLTEGEIAQMIGALK